MEIPASCSTSVRAALTAPTRPIELLGVADTAMYLRADGHHIVALLTHNAVRLPCGIVLAGSSRARPLRALVPVANSMRVGADRLTWLTGSGPVTVRVVREWAPERVRDIVVAPDVAADLRIGLPDVGIDAALADALVGAAPAAAVTALLGRGPGLTPSGDDVLAGFLLAAEAVGLEAGAVRAAVAAQVAKSTTALSACLLRHALDRECVPELAALLRACGAGSRADRRAALASLLQVGHTSGAALALGVAVAAAGAQAAGHRTGTASATAAPAPVAVAVAVAVAELTSGGR